MATRTIANAGGNWNTAATWVENAVPTSADDVVATATSGQLTIDAASACRSIDLTSYVGTLTHNAFTLTVGDASGGSLKFVAGMTYTKANANTSAIVLAATSTNGGTGWNITTGGNVLGNITFNGVGGKWVLQDALSTAGNWSHANGIVDTTSQSITISGQFSVTNASSKTFSPGSSAISVGLSTNAVNISSTVTLTVSSNTSVMTITNSAARFDCTAAIDWNGMSLVFSSGKTEASAGHLNGPASGTMTFKDVTMTGSATTSAGMGFSGSITLTGNLSLTPASSSHTRRIIVYGKDLGTPATLSVAGTITISYADFRDITATGAASWNLSAITGGCGDALGNTGITFTTPTTRYAMVAGNWSDTAMWSSTNGGAGGASVPLCHDDVFLTSSAGAGIYTQDVSRIAKNLVLTGFTRTFFYGSNPTIYGSLTHSSSVTLSGSTAFIFGGRGTHTITTGGAALNGFIFQAPSGTYTLQDAWTGGSTQNLTVTAGTFNTNNQSVTLSTNVTTSGSLTRSLVLGTTNLTFLSTSGNATIWSFANNTNMTLSAASSTMTIATNFGGGATGQTFAGGGLTYGTLNCTNARSMGPLIITGSNVWAAWTINAGHQINLTAGTTQVVGTYTVAGENRGYVYFQSSGSTSQLITTPDHADLDITGDYDLIVKVALDSWALAGGAVYFMSKMTSGSTDTSYAFGITSNGNLVVNHYTNGTGSSSSATSTANLPTAAGVTAGSTKWVRVARTGTTVQFFYGDDGVAWTQLGANVTNSSTMFSGAGPLNVGFTANGFIGRLYKLIVKSSQGGIVVAEFDATAKAFGADTYTDSTGKVWTLQNQQTVGDGRIKIISTSSGTPAYLSVPRTGLAGNAVRYYGVSDSRSGYLNLTSTNGWVSVPSPASDSTTEVEVVMRLAMDDWTPAASSALINRMVTSGNVVGNTWSLTLTTSGTLAFRVLNTTLSGFTGTSTVATGFTDGTIHWIKATWRSSDGRVQFWTAADAAAEPTGGSWTQLGSDRTAALTGTLNAAGNPINIGNYLTTQSDQLAGKVYAAIVRSTIGGTKIVDLDFTTMGTDQYAPTIFRCVQLQDNYLSGTGAGYAV